MYCIQKNIMKASAITLILQAVDEDETAILYGAIGFIYSLENFVFILVYRSVYDISLEKFPSAYLLLSSCLFLLAGFTATFLYTQKKHYYAREWEASVTGGARESVTVNEMDCFDDDTQL